MIVYRGPREAAGGVRNWGGTGAFGPNITENSLVCMASVPRMPGCPGSPLPETTIGWASPGPVMRAWDGPFASAGVASVSTVAIPTPAVRAVRTISRRGSVRRCGDGERGCLAEVSFQAQRDLAGAPDERVARCEPGRGCGWRAVAGDVHQFMRTLDPGTRGAVDLDLGHLAEAHELPEVDRVEVTGELIDPHQAIPCPAVDQGHDPPAIADQHIARPA